jgi:hypothetical protein
MLSYNAIQKKTEILQEYHIIIIYRDDVDHLLFEHFGATLAFIK